MRSGSAFAKRAVVSVLALASAASWADQDTASGGNPNGISAQVALNFLITVHRFVMLRVGAADSTISDVTFIPTVTPPVPGIPGNSRPYAGPRPPAFTVAAATTNPITASGSLPVAAFTTVPGTVLTCALTALAGATALAPAVTAAGVPGRNEILVATSGGPTGVPHPGVNLGACTGVASVAVPLATNLSGNYIYSTSFNSANLLAGTYGNRITYTITTP